MTAYVPISPEEAALICRLGRQNVGSGQIVAALRAELSSRRAPPTVLRVLDEAGIPRRTYKIPGKARQAASAAGAITGDLARRREIALATGYDPAMVR